MAISSPFFQWDIDTQHSCVESMRWISQPMSWAVRKISDRHHPESTICKVAIELLRRLNLPFIYLASEITLICCIAHSLGEKVKEIISSVSDRRGKLDQAHIFTAFQFGHLVGLLAWRRVELICEIVWQIFTGAVRVETEDRDPPAATPQRPIVSQKSKSSGDLGVFPSRTDDPKIAQIYQKIYSISKRQSALTRFGPASFSPKSGNRSHGLLPELKDELDQTTKNRAKLQKIDQEVLERCKIEQSQFPLPPSAKTAIPCEVTKDLTSRQTCLLYEFTPRGRVPLFTAANRTALADQEPPRISTPRPRDRPLASRSPSPVAFRKFSAVGPARRAKPRQLKRQA